MGRVIALGLDSASIGVIEEFAAAGFLPHFAALRERSVRCRLRSGPGFRHGTLWPQFVTGAEAELNGDWLRHTFDPDTYEAYQESAHYRLNDLPPFWERAAPRTITFDVPRTTVSGPGVHVTSWGAHAPLYPRASEPPGLLREIDARFGPHPAFSNDYACGWHDAKRLDRLTDALVTGARRRAEISAYLMQRFPDWQLFITVMSESHSASEIMWHAMDPSHPLTAYDPDARARLVRVFRGIDDALGLLLDTVQEDTSLLVFSLDGMRTSHGDLPSIVLLPELMHRLRFGRPLLRDPDQDSWRAAGCPPLIPRRGRPWRHDLDDRLVDPGPQPLRRRIQRLPGYEAARRTPPGRRLIERVKGAPLGALGVPIPPESAEPPQLMEQARERATELLFIGNYQPYWPQMRAFALPTFGDGYLRLNLVGRERDGIVTLDGYDDERRAFDALVHGLRDPRTGDPVVEEIQWLDARDALDPERRRYADAIIPWTHPTDAFEHPDVGTIGPFPFNRTGVHHGEGFLWASGPGIVACDLEDQTALNLPPTILRLLDRQTSLPLAGQPIPAIVEARAHREDATVDRMSGPAANP